MLCTNGHNNDNTASFCATCGTSVFQPIAPATYSGFAIASLVLGILWLYWVGSILALIFGYIARSRIKRNGQKGNGMAIAGIVLGWVGIASVILTFILGASGIFSNNSSAQALQSCEADGATISVAMAAFNAQHPGVTVTESDLTGTTKGGPYLESWANNPQYYSFTLVGGTLYLQGASSGSQVIAYTGPSSCVSIGL